MRRIVKIALLAVLVAAAGLALRRLLEPGPDAIELAPPANGDEQSATRNGTRKAAPSRVDGGPTRDQLYTEARRLEIQGRSKMNKQELQQAVEAAKTGGPA
jgi:hypothetical protein